MGRAPQPQPEPKEPEVVRMPSPNDPDLIAGMRRRVQGEIANRRGRSSTDLTGGGGDTGSYSRTTLG